MRCTSALRLALSAVFLVAAGGARALAAQERPAPVSRPAARTRADVAPPTTQRALLERVMQRTVLDNGLDVITVENHTVPLVTAVVVVRNGSFTQEPDEEGTAHLFEHMLFRSYQAPDGATFGESAAEFNGRYNGTTTEEAVTYYLVFPSSALQHGLQLLADLVRAPRFTAADLEREREVVLGEYDRAAADPFWHLRQEVGKRLWGDEFSRKNTIGNPDALRRATPELLRTLYARYYIPNNAALIVSGDVQPAQAVAAARAAFARWTRGDDPFAAHPIPPIPPLTEDRVVIVGADVQDVTVLMQWQGPSVRDQPQDTYAADVFSDLLNEPGSPFQQRLVDSGLFRALNVNYYTLAHVGPISVSGVTSPDRLRDALVALRDALQTLGDPATYPAEALHEVQKARRVSTAFGLERSTDFAHTVAFWWSVAGLPYYFDYVDNMAAQTVDDVAAYGRRYLVQRPKVIGLLVPDNMRVEAEGLARAVFDVSTAAQP
ncbi:MAG TPA: pitrilysin family protein [Gemmatimonadaceae bacterium]|nr:pitrilysin family protein [Gemmatimonadaceae bacterium]